MRPRIAVIGRTGQVAQALQHASASADVSMFALARPTVDLQAPETVAAALARERPDVIICPAAFTAVDEAESAVDQAFQINAKGAAGVAEAANALDIPLIHISTDYVFDGQKRKPYLETDPTNPVGVYGASKLAGEDAVLQAHPTNSVIVRTAWVYSLYGQNFVKTMLRLARERDTLKVVEDQIGTPTNAADLSTALLMIAKMLKSDPGNASLRGIFHVSGSGEATWAEFAQEIFRLSSACGGPTADVVGIPSSEYPTIAKRPPNSRLDTAKFDKVYQIRLADWRESLADVVSSLIHGMAAHQ